MPDPFSVLLFVFAWLVMNALVGIAHGCYRGFRDAWRFHHSDRKEN
jgi:hypothetical protein